jgi:hypothetical protein
MDETIQERLAQGSSAKEATPLLHPRVYALMIALAGWLVLSVWIFSGIGSTDYLLAIVSGFIFVAVALPFILSRQRRRSGDRETPSFRTWESLDFDTWTGRLRGSHAAAEILLPIAAVAFGMTAFGIVFLLVELTSTCARLPVSSNRVSMIALLRAAIADRLVRVL